MYLVFCEHCEWDRELRECETQPVICVKCGSRDIKEISWNPPKSLQLPPHWRVITRQTRWPWMGAYLYRGGLKVVASVGYVDFSGYWLQVSLSYDNKRPSYRDCVMVKEIFIGRDLDAIHVFPRRSRRVSDACCLHLWHRLDGETVPNFRVDY